MMLAFQPRRQSRHRHAGPPPPAGPPPLAVVNVVVRGDGGGYFVWLFDQPFADPGVGGWTPADFADLTVDGTVPDGIDEVVGADGEVTLVYPFWFGSSYHVIATPPVLRFAVGPAVIRPVNGPVV